MKIEKLLIAVLLLTGCDFTIPLQESELMEMPAVTASDYVVSYKGYTASYSSETLIPKWVAYELLPEEMEGNNERDDKRFGMDTSLRIRQAMREDYYGTDWTKGHMAPAADFRWDDEALSETFYFINVCPQNEKLNGKDWNFLEKQVRRWAKDYGKVWVVTGPIIGQNKYGRIGPQKVVVPDQFFKAVMVQDNRGKYHSIGFVMDNNSSRQYLKDCWMCINDLELITGLDFFPQLDDSIEESVEDQQKPSFWGIQ